MKKISKKSLHLNKLVISKLNNLVVIEGGSTIVNPTKITEFPETCSGPTNTNISDLDTLCTC